MIIPAIEPANPDIAEALRGRGDRAFGLVEQRLSDAPYFAGDEFTTADIIMAFPLTTMRLFVPRDISAYPNLKAYLAKIVERPAFKRALKVGDPGLKPVIDRSEEHTSELQSLMRISYAVFCLKKKK